MNNVSLIGRLTKDPELKTTSKGAKYCKFTVAVRRQVKKAEGVQDTDFIDCVAWNKNADILNTYFRQGSLLGIFGKVISSSYEKDGQKIKRQEILATELYIIEKRAQEPVKAPESPISPGQMTIEEAGDNYLPFEIV